MDGKEISQTILNRQVNINRLIGSLTKKIVKKKKTKSQVKRAKITNKQR